MIAEQISHRIVLEPARRSPQVVDFETRLRSRIVGQDEAVSQLVNVYQTVMAGMSVAGRPIASMLFLGPTGSGKTHVVEAAAEILFGHSDAMIKIDCAEYQHSHEIAKLIGSPPGYIGHRETSPALTQSLIDKYQTDKLKLSFVLFDEIEKASDSLWQLLLGILDKATLTLGDNQRVDFSHTVIILTSNLGASEMSRAVSGGIGFAPAPSGGLGNASQQKIHRAAIEAAKQKFSPEFMNRIDRVVVFRTLTHEQLQQILEIELNKVQDRILWTGPENVFVFHRMPQAKEFLLKEGTDPKYGARPLKRAIERHLVVPLSSLMATGQLLTGDIVTVELAADGVSLDFVKEEMPALEPIKLPTPKKLSHRAMEHLDS